MQLKPSKTDPELLKKLDASKRRVENMSKEDRAEMWQKQRESWVRANLYTGDPRWD